MGFWGISPILLYLLVIIIFFTVWILNIFIGVVTDAYHAQQEIAKCHLRHERCIAGLRYLLRATVVPSRLPFLPTNDMMRSTVLKSLGVIVMGALMGASWVQPDILGPYPHLFRVSVYCSFTFAMYVMPFQCREETAPWTTTGSGCGS